MLDRSSKPSSRSPETWKMLNIILLKLKLIHVTESSDITESDTTQVSSDTWKPLSTSNWFCVISNRKSTSRKTWQTSLLFLEPLQIQNLKRKCGVGMAYCILPTSKTGETRLPCPPPNCAHAFNSSFTKRTTYTLALCFPMISLITDAV